MRIVIDTNIILVSLSPKSESHWIIKELINGKLNLCLTDEIIYEYQEIIERFMGYEFASDSISFLLSIPSIIYIRLYYSWLLLSQDPDDNKFSDCYIASSAKYLITQDAGFNSLKEVKFPIINVISLTEFKEIYFNSNKA